ncbi:hypothetical protein AB1046_15065 [Promicromonospora sp. Populi]|uniref:hypothetical protein n=1 Tax=Promicromonospora sp. Populi TaxID=3239420 RepID=UPI0034E2323E
MNPNDTMSPTRVIETLRPVNRALTWGLFASLAVTTAGLATGTNWLVDLGCAGIVLNGPAGVLTMLTMLVAQVIADALATEADEVARTTPAGPIEATANGSESPATGSGPATPENRRILRK